MKQGKAKVERPPEHSIEFRLGVLALTVLGITASCLIVKTAIPFTCLYVWGAVAGSYVSYHYRNEKNPWVTWVIVLGTLLVTGNCLMEVMNALAYGPLAWLVPIVHQLCGMLALHSFEMKSRYELNVSALLSLLLLSICAPVARGIDFGACVLAYISLGALVLYFDNRSLTLAAVPSSGPSTLTNLPQVVNLRQQIEPAGRPRFGKDALVIVCLPLISIIAFTLVPRNDFLFDWFSSEVKKLTERTSLADLLKLSRSDTQDLRNPQGNFFMPIRPRRLHPEPKQGPKKTAQEKPPSVKPKEEKKPPEKSKEERPKHPGEKPKKANQPGKNPKKESKSPEKAKKVNLPSQNPKKENKHPEKAKKENLPGQNPKKESKPPKQKVEAAKPKPKAEPKSENNSKLSTTLPKPAENPLMFKVSGSRTVYSRQNCYDYFDGQTWSTNDNETKKTFIKPERGLYDFSKCDLLVLEKGFPSVSVILQYSVESDVGKLMPVGGLVQKLDYSGDSVSIDVYRRLFTQQPLTKGTKYKVFAQIPVYDQKKMRLAKPPDPEEEKALEDDLTPFLQVPENEDTRVVELAHKLTDNQGNWFHRCELISHYLRKNYQMTDVKPQPPEGGDTVDNTVDQFLLETKKGDCKDFASSFVILSRIAGIPTRIVSGYAPGTANAVTGQMEVHLTDAHAWGEAYIPGYDWVPFDATPNGYLPDRPPQANYSLASIQKKLSEDSRMEAEKRELKNFWQRIKPYLPFIVAGVIALALLIAGIIFGRKHYRRWLLERSRHPSRAIYRMVMKKLKQAKLDKLPSETSKEFVQRISSDVHNGTGKGILVDHDLTALLAQFLDTYAAVYFGDQPKMSELQELGTHLVSELQARKVR
jgi:hypothetical protein